MYGVKLYQCSEIKTHDDYYGLVVAQNEEEAKKKFIEQNDGEYFYSIHAWEVKEVDGFKVKLTKDNYHDVDEYYKDWNKMAVL